MPLLTAEVRWFRTGAVPSAVRDAFLRPSALGPALSPAPASRVDVYFLIRGADASRVGLKFREGRLEHKLRHGDPRSVAIPGGAEGCLEFWSKETWESAGPLSLAGPQVRVAKRRWLRRTAIDGLQVEVSEVEIAGVSSWTLAVESSGWDEARLLSGAATVFASGIATGEGLTAVDSQGYPEWLSRRARP